MIRMNNQKKEHCVRCNSSKFSVETFCTKCETFCSVEGFYTEKIYPLVLSKAKELGNYLSNVFEEGEYKSVITDFQGNKGIFSKEFGKGILNYKISFRSIDPSDYKVSKELDLDPLYNITGLKTIRLKKFELGFEFDVYYFLAQTKEGRNIKETMKHEAIFKYEL